MPNQKQRAMHATHTRAATEAISRTRARPGFLNDVPDTFGPGSLDRRSYPQIPNGEDNANEAATSQTQATRMGSGRLVLYGWLSMASPVHELVSERIHAMVRNTAVCLGRVA